jgi:hypothetical protein
MERTDVPTFSHYGYEALPASSIRGDPMAATLIDFVCVRADHRPRTLADRPELTIHRGGWAFCRQSQAGGHEWHQISPRTRDDLASWARSASDRAPYF